MIACSLFTSGTAAASSSAEECRDQLKQELESEFQEEGLALGFPDTKDFEGVWCDSARVVFAEEVRKLVNRLSETRLDGREEIADLERLLSLVEQLGPTPLIDYTRNATRQRLELLRSLWNGPRLRIDVGSGHGILFGCGDKSQSILLPDLEGSESGWQWEMHVSWSGSTYCRGATVFQKPIRAKAK